MVHKRPRLFECTECRETKNKAKMDTSSVCKECSQEKQQMPLSDISKGSTVLLKLSNKDIVASLSKIEDVFDDVPFREYKNIKDGINEGKIFQFNYTEGFLHVQVVRDGPFWESEIVRDTLSINDTENSIQEYRVLEEP